MTMPSVRIGETPLPKLPGTAAGGILNFQSSLPDRSWQTSPQEPKYDTIRCPSVAGVDAAGLPSVLWKGSIFGALASARHASLPSARLYAIVYSLPPSNAVMTSL